MVETCKKTTTKKKTKKPEWIEEREPGNKARRWALVQNSYPMGIWWTREMQEATVGNTLYNAENCGTINESGL